MRRATKLFTYLLLLQESNSYLSGSSPKQSSWYPSVAAATLSPTHAASQPLCRKLCKKNLPESPQDTAYGILADQYVSFVVDGKMTFPFVGMCISKKPTGSGILHVTDIDAVCAGLSLMANGTISEPSTGRCLTIIGINQWPDG